MNTQIENILLQKASFQANTWANISKEISILDVLTQIKQGVYVEQVNRLRALFANGEYQAYNAEKLRLPAVAFCGKFKNERKKESLYSYNHLIVIDIDKLSTSAISEIGNKLRNDHHILSFWKSPSNFGIKGIVPLEFNYEISDVDYSHKVAFNKLYNYFLSKHNIELDRSGSDTTRLCFLSYDPEIVIKEEVLLFPINSDDSGSTSEIKQTLDQKTRVFDKSVRNALFNPQNRNKGIHKRAIKDILNYLTKRRIVITGEYERRYKIAYAIANTFTFDIGKIFFLALCNIEVDKFDEQRELKLLQYCYEKNAGLINFKYIEDLVENEYGYIKRKLENGVP